MLIQILCCIVMYIAIGGIWIHRFGFKEGIVMLGCYTMAGATLILILTLTA